MRTSKFVTVLSALCLVLAACGGGGDDASKFEDPGTGNTGGNNGGSGGTVTPTAITVMSSVPSIPSDGSGTADITALVRDVQNNLVQGVTVTFQASSGGIAVTQATTDANGAAKATLSTAGDTTLRTITVTANAGSLLNTVNVQVVSGSSNSTTVQMGSGTGANFQPGVLGIGNATLSAGGSTSLTAVLQQSDGTLFTQPATVTFSSPCIANGLANVGAPVQTSSGIANATYAAAGCSGADSVTATATINSSPVSAAGSITVAASTIGSIVFESATPPNIALKGTGDTSRPEASTVIFRVLDATGGPSSNADVTFSLNTSVGGLAIGPLTAKWGTDGRVQTVVNAGTAATTVRVTATVTSVTPNIATQSNQLTVTTGIPDQDSFSLAVQCPNVEALNTDGVTVPVTARLADRFNNPVPNGTAVTFTAEGGSIQSSCVTTTTQTEAGVCTVNWTSSNPRPSGTGVFPDLPARASLLATAIGEESFNDTNGNGTFDNVDTFTDLGERYVDTNENNAYDVGEPIYDFNNNSSRDPADGLFNGVLCLATNGTCDATKKTTGISAKNVIIMSGTTAVTTPANGGTLAMPSGNGSRTFNILFADVNGNPMPSGTTVNASIAGTGLTLGTPSSFTVPCTTAPTSFPFTVTAKSEGATLATDGTLTIVVTTPKGIVTPLSFTVDIP
jgi:hypothetical protein